MNFFDEVEIVEETEMTDMEYLFREYEETLDRQKFEESWD